MARGLNGGSREKCRIRYLDEGMIPWDLEFVIHVQIFTQPVHISRLVFMKYLKSWVQYP